MGDTVHFRVFEMLLNAERNQRKGGRRGGDNQVLQMGPSGRALRSQPLATALGMQGGLAPAPEQGLTVLHQGSACTPRAPRWSLP